MSIRSRVVELIVSDLINNKFPGNGGEELSGTQKESWGVGFNLSDKLDIAYFYRYPEIHQRLIRSRKAMHERDPYLSEDVSNPGPQMILDHKATGWVLRYEFYRECQIVEDLSITSSVDEELVRDLFNHLLEEGISIHDVTGQNIFSN